MKIQKEKLPQFMLPRGLVGRVIARMMPLGHNAIYKRVSRVLNLKPEDELVEVACGGGHFLKKYASHARYVAGLDLSEVQVKMAKRNLKDRIKAGTADIVLGDASKLPWANDRYSAVTVMGSVMGFPEPLESLKEMRRVLRPGGRAVISIEYNAEDGKDYSDYINKYGMWLWKEEDVVKMMREAGFAEVSISYDKGMGMPKMMFAQGIKQ